MPHIRIRSITAEEAQRLSLTLVPELANLVQAPEDHFTLELVATSYFAQGQVTPGSPFVEILWFARSQELQNKAAKLVSESLRAVTQAEDVVVVFHELKRSAYYENGEHF